VMEIGLEAFGVSIRLPRIEVRVGKQFELLAVMFHQQGFGKIGDRMAAKVG